jgi:hypothetical protein
MIICGCGSSRYDCTASAINLFAVPNLEDQHNEAVVLNFANKPVITYAVFPEFPKAGALQGLPDAARIFEIGYSLLKELQNAAAMLRIKLAQLPVRGNGKLNLPCHDAS